ncbi:hypothetical protein PsYK624_014850 [Phanerochaete sordida]|uniref:DUF6593 domain-containing protein n=1 Tax=Phanerochaete sordida TaxID=48140 RepID=A0A9P3L7T4_9APHY|nr:hypothetical protein PsYK624_014850 [Phanerochaete sordida]
MIILESEWDEAAGVAEHNERNGEVSPGTQHFQSTEELRNTSSPSQLSISRGSRGSDTASSAYDPPSSITSGQVSHDALPSYEDNTSPHVVRPVIYVFAPVLHSFNSMVVRSQTASIPLYHIAVRMNCFIPSSYITVITRGDTVEGEEVGQFEMGMTLRKGTITMNGVERVIETVLVKGGNRMSRTWQWKFETDPSKHLSWAFDNPVKYCYLGTKSVGNSSHFLATFTPPPLVPRADGRPAPAATLKVFPAGQAFLDDILISALILERRRLAPS